MLLDNDAVGDAATAIAVHPGGDLVFVTNKTADTVSVYDRGTQAVANTVTVGAQPTGIAYSPDGARVYVANSGGNSVAVLDGGERRRSPGLAIRRRHWRAARNRDQRERHHCLREPARPAIR